MKDDTIYRQTAIKAVVDLPNCYNGYSNTYDKACIIGVLEELPPAQPERKKGKWISPTPEMIRSRICGSCEVLCSACKTPAIDEYDFCPNCGADMREVTE